jgi:NADH:ubiquinone oxidoreductase subunit F (NADH-binding)/(2Fe-2S) ferredoxin/NAD-dependent dihydropyrimidine dehydrogenase PreA subunit
MEEKKMNAPDKNPTASTKGRKKLRSVEDLNQIYQRIRASRNPNEPTILVCGGTGCRSSGCLAVYQAVSSEISRQGLDKKVRLRLTGCPGFCERGPLVIVLPEKIFYQRVRANDAAEIVEKTLKGKEIVERLLYQDPASGKKIVTYDSIPFFAKQKQVLMGQHLYIEGACIEDYLALGGYQALTKVLTSMKPEQVIEIIKKAGLRGRGGGGFPAGVKWETALKAEGDERFVVANGDEGDPGAFMNRSLMEDNPHSILEGMIIGSYAIGAHQGFIYVRDEYPLAVNRLTAAVEQAKEYGLLGDNILGSGHSLTIRIVRGGGAFVCGESTALMASIEGRPGEPRSKYIHTVEKGLWNQPTVLNNVETWANVPLIIRNGIDWFTAMGTGEVSTNPWGGSKGTKIFSLVGKVNNTGLVEVPMGITLREIIFDIGGGISKGRKFKAVQTGGPSGGCIPESLLDMPVDYDELTRVGSMMGSGGMIVMDDRTCMVDVARYFVNFLQQESCGKCVPCREGLRQMGEILERICQGRGQQQDLATLEDLGRLLSAFSLCALGGTAANPVLTTLRYFRDEYEAHLKKKCPAGVCKDLVTYRIDAQKCNGCTLCAKNCPQNCIKGEVKKPHLIDAAACVKCGTCEEVCKQGAIIVE